MPVYNALVAGIGGQGVITLGTLLKKAGIRAGLCVSGSERRGGAQREGHVAAIVRYQWPKDGRAPDERHDVCSPMLCAGTANMLIGLEPLEAVRLAGYLNSDSTVILNTFPLVPIPVKLEWAVYPETGVMIQMLERLTSHIFAWNLTEIARERFGHSRALNAMCLGIASAIAGLPISQAHLLELLREEGRPEDTECFRFGIELANDKGR
ncbi:MAG: indolepyruvate oxidoreductase subunit beta [Candidatus Abyssubacteria bacterium]